MYRDGHCAKPSRSIASSERTSPAALDGVGLVTEEVHAGQQRRDVTREPVSGAEEPMRLPVELLHPDRLAPLLKQPVR